MNSHKNILDELEKHYRHCACRSTTPLFSDRPGGIEAGSSHLERLPDTPYRTYYQHDRDKILYSRSFRRLRLKTQIFPEQTGDHLRTRLDHTLEVAQIARHLARQLRLNEDLVDAISLGHDIGHTPFGHSGERALHRFVTASERKSLNLQGFKHNWQGLRVATKLDKSYPDREGLDLTSAVLLGILKHTKLKYTGIHSAEPCDCDMKNSWVNDKWGLSPEEKWTDIFEVQLCALADEIGQLVHNLEDAITSEAVSLEELCRNGSNWPLIAKCIESIQNRLKENPRVSGTWKNIAEEFVFWDSHEASLLLARLKSELIYILSVDIANAAGPKLDKWEKEHCPSQERLNSWVQERRDFPTIIKLYDEENSADDLAKRLTDLVIRSERVSRMDGKADHMIRKVLDVYLSRPLQVHDEILDEYCLRKQPLMNGHPLRGSADIRRLKEEELDQLALGSDPIFVRAAVDYVAGMTDRFAMREYDQMYSAYPRSDL